VLVLIIIIGIIWFLFDWLNKPNLHEKKSYEPREYVPQKSRTYSQKKVKLKRSPNKRTYNESKTKTNKDILLEAISANRNVSFSYVDKSDQVTSREVTPRKVFWYEFGEEGRMECLDAHCLLRNESRTFALFRISNLSIK
jgi:predicted DNA-binding transcriptional regulator YafY